jgi:CheY-like chemotaxis protein
MPDGGRLTLEAANFVLESWFAPIYPGLAVGNYVVLSVADTGAGIPADVLARVFEPFFTTKEGARGTGLGLSMVYGYMKQSGGGITIDSEPGVGTRVSLYFPRSADVGDAAAAEPAPAAAEAGGCECILVVEDNPEVRKVAVGVVQSLGYAVEVATTAAEALAALKVAQFDLVFSDIVMPEMSGIELAREVRQLYPQTAILLTSGFASKLSTGTELAALGASFLAKPYRRAILAAALRNALDGAKAAATAPAATPPPAVA